ncbi:MAG: PIN domain-containing protein [Desulfobacteraceae bacterium]|nr:MAG: PIN domain-containing protein [Desulfobacteraceae bacterium]
MVINAVIDTNIWISALLNPHGHPALLRASFETGKFQAVIRHHYWKNSSMSSSARE